MGRYQPFYDHAQRGARRSCGCRYRSGRERHPPRRSARGDGRFHRAGLIHRRRCPRSSSAPWRWRCSGGWLWRARRARRFRPRRRPSPATRARPHDREGHGRSDRPSHQVAARPRAWRNGDIERVTLLNLATHAGKCRTRQVRTTIPSPLLRATPSPPGSRKSRCCSRQTPLCSTRISASTSSPSACRPRARSPVQSCSRRTSPVRLDERHGLHAWR